jgi:hypothetical protein
MEEGRKEESEGGGEKVLGGAWDGILALCAATMEEFPCTRPPASGCRPRTTRGPRPAAAAQRTVFSERGTGESSLRGAAALAFCAAHLRSRDAQFELAVGPLQLR